MTWCLGDLVDLATSGQYAIGTFTAVDTSKILTLDAQPPMGNAFFTGYQIRKIPPKGTMISIQ